MISFDNRLRTYSHLRLLVKCNVASFRTWDKDRFMSHDIEQATRIIKSGIVSRHRERIARHDLLRLDLAND